jgi:putative nucleotidyltransferase with HDIG domain
MVEEKNTELINAYEEIQRSYNFTLEALIAMLDAREQATGQHSLRVRDLTLIVGRAMDLSADELDLLARGALLHDIGKIATPDAVLLKPGKLTKEEWTVMQKHVETGYNIVRASQYLAPAAQIILQHHEKFDGTGYPNGTKGTDICLGARIFSVIDAYDAIRSVRPYKPSISLEEAVAEIERSGGSHFDPEIVTVFLSVLDKIEACAHWEQQ